MHACCNCSRCACGVQDWSTHTHIHTKTGTAYFLFKRFRQAQSCIASSSDGAWDARKKVEVVDGGCNNPSPSWGKWDVGLDWEHAAMDFVASFSVDIAVAIWPGVRIVDVVVVVASNKLVESFLKMASHKHPLSSPSQGHSFSLSSVTPSRESSFLPPVDFPLLAPGTIRSSRRRLTILAEPSFLPPPRLSHITPCAKRRLLSVFPLHQRPPFIHGKRKADPCSRPTPSFRPPPP